MVVEDDPDIMDALRDLLEEEGFDVLWATNGKEALSCLATNLAPRLILLDLMMPVMNGWEFQQALRSDPGLSGIPVIVISAEPDLDRETHSLAVDGYLSKPFQLTALLDTVHRFC